MRPKNIKFAKLTESKSDRVKRQTETEKETILKLQLAQYQNIAAIKILN